MISAAQEVRGKWDQPTCLYGLYNERYGKWVVRPKYSDVDYLGAYNGTHYWKVKSKESSLWGVVSSDDYNQFRISPQYTEISRANSFSSVPILAVKKNADWGIIEIGTKSCLTLVRCQYEYLYLPGEGLTFKRWEGSNVLYALADLKKLYDNALQREQQAKKEAEDKRIAAEKARRDSIARAEKEKRLSSFTLYAKEYITPKVNEWQQKDEFETIAEYQERVTGANREQKIRELSKEAEDLFIKENIKLNPLGNLSIDPYDAENKVYSIRSPRFGQLLIPVPRENNEARIFKEHFEAGDVFTEDPVFFIDNDKIALKSVDFHDMQEDKKYHYSNQLALNYQQYEIDFNALDIAPVRITSSTTTTLDIKTIAPKCDILSPLQGSTYSTPTIRLRYTANVDPQTTYSVKFFVNGKEEQPITSGNAGMTAKGAKVVNGIEVELPMPQEIGREVVVAVQVVDGTGAWAEPKSVSLKYAGEKPKPTLYLLAVGVSNYAASDLQSLHYAAKDAQDFVQTITNSDLSMYKEIKPTLLIDEDATTRNIQRALYQLTSRTAQGDVVMLFFSGHGIVKNKERYFMSADASAEEFYNGLEFEFIRKRMTEMSDDKQCKVLVFMDACHSGAMAGTKGSLQDITFATPGVIGFYSSTAGEQSAETDNMQNGVFTRVLLDGLKGGAKDAEGQVTIHKLDTYIKENVKAKTHGKQTPIVENTTGDAVLFHIK